MCIVLILRKCIFSLTSNRQFIGANKYNQRLISLWYNILRKWVTLSTTGYTSHMNICISITLMLLFQDYTHILN